MSTLKVNALQDTSGNPLSRVLQAATTVDSSSSQSVTSTSYVDAGSLSVAITPTFTSSKILVMATVNVQCFVQSIETNGSTRLLRGSTEIIEYPYSFVMEAGTSGNGRIFYNQNHTQIYLDSPSTTSSTTYKVQIKLISSGNSAQVIYNQNSSKSVITAMEIAA